MQKRHNKTQHTSKSLTVTVPYSRSSGRPLFHGRCKSADVYHGSLFVLATVHGTTPDHAELRFGVAPAKYTWVWAVDTTTVRPRLNFDGATRCPEVENTQKKIHICATTTNSAFRALSFYKLIEEESWNICIRGRAVRATVMGLTAVWLSSSVHFVRSLFVLPVRTNTSLTAP